MGILAAICDSKIVNATYLIDRIEFVTCVYTGQRSLKLNVLDRGSGVMQGASSHRFKRVIDLGS